MEMLENGSCLPEWVCNKLVCVLWVVSGNAFDVSTRMIDEKRRMQFYWFDFKDIATVLKLNTMKNSRIDSKSIRLEMLRSNKKLS